MLDRDRRPREELSQASLALEQRQLAQVLAVQVQDVEGIQVKSGTAAAAFRLAQQSDPGGRKRLPCFAF